MYICICYVHKGRKKSHTNAEQGSRKERKIGNGTPEGMMLMRLLLLLLLVSLSELLLLLMMAVCVCGLYWSVLDATKQIDDTSINKNIMYQYVFLDQNEAKVYILSSFFE